MPHNHHTLLLIGFTATLVVRLGCGSATNAVETYHYTIPEKTNDGWETAQVSDENIDTLLVHELFNRVINNTYENVHSVLIIRNGRMVVEEYFPGRGSSGQYRQFMRDTLHEMHSVTKSVNSILIGIAIDQHLISRVDQKFLHSSPNIPISLRTAQRT